MERTANDITGAAARPSIHTTSGRWRLGVYLALGAAVMWGLLPVALAGLLRHMDAVTITWYRFLIAGVLLAVPVARSRALAPLRGAGRATAVLLTVASLALAGNYVLYVLSLKFVSPSTAQVMIQLAPMFMLLGSLLVFRESFGRLQRMGLALLVAGLVLFFDDEVPALLAGESSQGAGIALLLGAAVTWAVYALAQKQLLRNLSSSAVLLVVYAAGTLVLTPFATPSGVAALDAVGLALLVFLALNTLIAYGCFAEALEHLEASRVSLVLALTPVVTIAAVTAGSHFWPAVIAPDLLSHVSLVGAGLAVAGSMLGALSRRAA